MKQQRPEEEMFLPGRTSATCHTLQIKCPYFRAHGHLEVRCAGITDDTRIALRFLDKRSLRQHEKLFCDDRYWCCEICRLLDELDEEDQ